MQLQILKFVTFDLLYNILDLEIFVDINHG